MSGSTTQWPPTQIVLTSSEPYLSDGRPTAWHEQGDQGDQVVPSCRGARGAKPLPPTPDPEELAADETMEGDEEFFCSDRRRLLPKRGVACPGGCGQVNQRGVACPGGRGQVNQRGAACPGGRGLVNEAYQECGAGASGAPQEKPRVPPRAPLPPPGVTPPEVPPRVPLLQPRPRRPPRTLPLYVNGVMPATQSFAPDPHYVSRTAPLPPAGQPAPCIVPLVADGQRTSSTHYLLLPSRGRGPQWGLQDR